MRSVPLAVLTATLVALSGAALAADEPKNLVDYRSAVMRSLGGHAGAIAAIVKQQVSYDHVAAHAEAIAATAPAVRDVFPENSGPDDYAETDALPAIWENPEDFAEALEAFETAAAAFPAAAQSGDRAQILEAFQKLGGSCGACHEDFRAED
ncbi:MAG: cytochrome c [Tistlia sp.]|uniref:c-type cytochrome n=1 Tax=Tistlia sp. TaxID=3057121 RepID=UPI0034A10954